MSLLGGQDIKRVYFAWWVVYLLLSVLLIALQYFVPGANPFSFVTYSAMFSLISLLVSVLATLIGTIVLYRDFPPELTEQLDRLPELVAAFGFAWAKAPGYEADDFLAAAAASETARGGTTLVVTSDRDAFQLASRSRTGSGR